MLYQRNDAITLADLLAICEFATQDSIAFGLHTPDEPRRPLGWIDSHVTCNQDRELKKVYFRLCIERRSTNAANRHTGSLQVLKYV